MELKKGVSMFSYDLQSFLFFLMMKDRVRGVTMWDWEQQVSQRTLKTHLNIVTYTLKILQIACSTTFLSQPFIPKAPHTLRLIHIDHKMQLFHFLKVQKY